MPTVEFGSRDAANRFRNRPAVRQHLTDSDDRRSTTVRLSSSAPRRVLERAESQAFTTQREQRGSAGMAELSDAEIQSLKRQHPTFDWQSHGFEAMRTKAALQRAGSVNWQDHFSPGEGAESALGELRRSKEMSARTGAPASVERGRRTDEEELVGGGRQRRQAEQFSDAQVSGARRPAILSQDVDAQDFLREEESFGGDPFDLSFRPDPDGRGVEPVGETAELLEERHASRSVQAQRTDNRLAAPKTRDPIKWTNNPDQLDFPGIDTVGEPVRQELPSLDPESMSDGGGGLPSMDPPEASPPSMDLSDDPT